MSRVAIQTERLLIREFGPEDREAFASYHADPRYVALYGDALADHAATLGLLATFQRWRDERPRVNYQLAVHDRRGVRGLVGCCGLRGEGHGRDTAEFGIELAPDNWGRYRYAIEITEAMAEFAFEHLRLEVLVGRTTDANLRARRLARWFGAQEVSSRPGKDWMAGRNLHEVEWRISHEHWQAAPHRDSRR